MQSSSHPTTVMTQAAASLPDHTRPAATWNAGGAAYERISAHIADAIEHCIGHLDPRPGERILDLATGTGMAARRAAARSAEVVAVDVVVPREYLISVRRRRSAP